LRRRTIAVIHEDSTRGILDEKASAQSWNRHSHGAGDENFDLAGGALNGERNDIHRIGQKLLGSNTKSGLAARDPPDGQDDPSRRPKFMTRTHFMLG
jgi:hypothetical protein